MYKQNGKKKVKRSERKTECENTQRFIENNTKKVTNWKTPDNDIMHGYCLKKFTSIHNRLAIEMNSYQQETDIPGWMTKGKTLTWSKKTTKKELPTTTADP